MNLFKVKNLRVEGIFSVSIEFVISYLVGFVYLWLSEFFEISLSVQNKLLNLYVHVVK